MNYVCRLFFKKNRKEKAKMGNGEMTPLGMIIAILAGIGVVVSIIVSIAADIELLGFLF